MRGLRVWLVRLAALFNRDRGDRDMDDEIESLVQLHADELVQRGASPQEARRRAVLAVGGVEALREAHRDRRGLPLLETFGRDVRYAARVLRQRPGFSLAAITILALGIGANTAIFSVVHAVLLRPLPFADPDRLVQVWHVPPPASFPGLTRFAVSPANFADWQRQNHVFERMAIVRGTSFNLGNTSQPETLRAARVSAGYFPLLGVDPLVGRTFSADEERPGGPKVVVLGYGLWTRRFGADRSIVGRTISLDGEPHTVIGVMGPSFRYPDWAQLWAPTAWTGTQWAVRDNHNCTVVARLKPGVDVRRAQAEMDTISARLAHQYPADDSGWGAVVVQLHEGLVEDVRPTLLVLLGAVAFVLLIACANVANLVLARTLARRRELAVRLALGAGRGRVLRQVLTETALLGVLGGIVGLAVARGALRLIVAFLGDALPTSMDVALDAPVLAAALGLSITSGIAAGLAAAQRATATTLTDAMRQGGRTGSEGGSSRARAVLVAAEVALSIVLLVGAGLMLRTVWILKQIDPGIDPRGVTTTAVVLPDSKYPEQRATQFYDRLAERVRSLPGVEAAGFSSYLPLDPEGGSRWPIALEGAPPVVAAELPQVAGLVISPGYLEALRVPILRGRSFDAHDTADSPSVALVSDAMARRFWPGGDPIGKRLSCIFFPGLIQVVGVVRDVKLEGLDNPDPVQAIYLPLAQHPNPYMSLAVRGATGQDAIANAIAAAVHSLDPDQPLTDVRTMDDLVAGSLAQRRFTMLLLGAFAAVALGLAAVGIYSVLAYAVRQRVREIGIRLALGARAAEVVRMIVIQGLTPTIVGVVAGLAGAAALSRVLTRFVYGVSRLDPPTFGVVGALVLGVGAFACALPAWRATTIDPLATLREE